MIETGIDKWLGALTGVSEVHTVISVHRGLAKV